MDPSRRRFSKNAVTLLAGASVLGIANMARADTTMKTKLSTVKNRRIESQAFFIIFKLPVLLITPILGFIVEFLYELPFMLVCLLGSRFRK